MVNNHLFSKILVPIDGSEPSFHAGQIASNVADKFKECVYICRDFTCSLPMYTLSDLKNYFNSN